MKSSQVCVGEPAQELLHIEYIQNDTLALHGWKAPSPIRSSQVLMALVEWATRVLLRAGQLKSALYGLSKLKKPA